MVSRGRGYTSNSIKIEKTKTHRGRVAHVGRQLSLQNGSLRPSPSREACGYLFCNLALGAHVRNCTATWPFGPA